MKPIQYWAPVLFCGFLSIVTIINLTVGYEKAMWALPFLALLPICFHLTKTNVQQMNKEISTLRQRIVELEETLDKSKQSY